MDHFVYIPDQAVCSTKIELEIEDGIIRKAEFTGGCPGNAIAVNKLCCGRSAEEITGLLKGIRCGGKKTSCADQLACALAQYLNRKKTDKEA